jgi:hypothetical protein
MAAQVSPASGQANDDLLTVCAISLLAEILANVLHEGLGHAAIALLTGAKSGVLTTVAWSSDFDSRLVAAGGTMANLAAAMVFWIALRRTTRRSAQLLAHFSACGRNHDWLRRHNDTLEFPAMVHHNDVVHDGKGEPRNVERKGAGTIRIDGVGSLEGPVGERDAADRTLFVGDLREVAVAVEGSCTDADELLDGAGHGGNGACATDVQGISTFQSLVAAGEGLV